MKETEEKEFQGTMGDCDDPRKSGGHTRETRGDPGPGGGGWHMEARETREYQRNMRRTAREMKEDTMGAPRWHASLHKGTKEGS